MTARDVILWRWTDGTAAVSGLRSERLAAPTPHEGGRIPADVTGHRTESRGGAGR